MFRVKFQIFSYGILALILIGCSNQPNFSQAEPVKFDITADVKTICQQVSQRYAYFQARAIYWDEACQRAENEALAVDSWSGTLTVLERLIDDLYDPHITLNTNNQLSPRLVPSGSDIWFKRVDGTYIASAVRPLSGASKAGIMVGDQLISFNGLAPEELALTRIHSGMEALNDARKTWAINAAVAARRADSRNIQIRRGGALLTFDMQAPDLAPSKDLLLYRTVSQEVGYIRFNNSLGNTNAVEVFNQALSDLRQTHGLIIDLRETPSGGNTIVAEPIIGRFIQKPTAYQRTVFPDGSSEDRKVTPTGTWTYNKPIIILVGRWTGSMGEGMAIGFDGMSRAKVMGSEMAGLAGGTESIRLEETGVSFSLPTYDLHHLDGTPRYDWKPLTILTADNGAQEDVLLKEAISALKSED